MFRGARRTPERETGQLKSTAAVRTLLSRLGREVYPIGSMARQRARRGERVAETFQLGGSRGVKFCPFFLQAVVVFCI